MTLNRDKVCALSDISKNPLPKLITETKYPDKIATKANLVLIPGYGSRSDKTANRRITADVKKNKKENMNNDPISCLYASEFTPSKLYSITTEADSSSPNMKAKRVAIWSNTLSSPYSETDRDRARSARENTEIEAVVTEPRMYIEEFLSRFPFSNLSTPMSHCTYYLDKS